MTQTNSCFINLNKTVFNYFFPLVTYIFFIGFFLFPSSKFISNYFYAFIAFPFSVLFIIKKIRLKLLFKSHIFSSVLFFLLYMWLTVFWRVDFEFKELIIWGKRIVYILIYLVSLIYLIHNYPLFLDKLLTILCVVSSLFAIVYATKFYIDHPFPETRLAGYALLFNPIRASSLYGTLGISCFYLIHRYNSTKALFVYLLILLPIIFFIILSQSRGPLLSFSIILFLFFVMFAKTFKVNGQSIYLLSSSIIILFIIFIFIGFYYDYFMGLMFNRGLSYRSEIWLAFLKFLKHKFLFGYGLGADSSVKLTDGTIFLHPHNVYIATFYYGGVIGLLLQIYILCTSAFYTFFQDKSYNSILFGLMVLFGFLCIITDGNLIIQHPKPFWIFFWFPIAIISALELKNKNITFI